MFDVDTLRRKYAEERERRLRPDGIAQYVEIAGRFARFAEDPWADGQFEREPLTDEVDVAVVGAGFGGLLTGARLRRARRGRRAPDRQGGRRGRHLVLEPLSGDRLRRRVVRVHAAAGGTRLHPHRAVCQGRGDPDALPAYRRALRPLPRRLPADRGTRDPLGVGDFPLDHHHRPGRRDARPVRFLGQRIHPEAQTPGHSRYRIVRWPTCSTPAGGTTATPASDWSTCPASASASSAPEPPPSSACRTWPHAAQRLLVFQRTPSSVDVRANQPTDPQWAAAVEPGWQQRRIENFQILTAGGQADEDLVADAWTSITKKLPVMRWESDGGPTPEQRAKNIELADFAKMEEIRAQSRRHRVRSRHRRGAQTLVRVLLQAAVLPRRVSADVQPGQRHPGRHPRAWASQRITETGVVVDGVHHELDCLIFATGFEVGTDYCRRTGFELIGRDGQTLTGNWRDGVRTFQGLMVRGSRTASSRASRRPGSR